MAGDVVGASLCDRSAGRHLVPRGSTQSHTRMPPKRKTTKAKKPAAPLHATRTPKSTTPGQRRRGALHASQRRATTPTALFQLATPVTPQSPAARRRIDRLLARKRRYRRRHGLDSRRQPEFPRHTWRRSIRQRTNRRIVSHRRDASITRALSRNSSGTIMKNFATGFISSKRSPTSIDGALATV